MTDAVPLAGYGGPDINHGPKLIASTAVVTAFAFIAVVLRMYVRVVVIKAVGWDDKFTVLAMIVSLIGMFLVIPEVQNGAGRHAYFLADEPTKQGYALYLNFISEPVLTLGVSLVKVSIGLFLLRLTPSKFFRRFIWSMQAFMAIYTTIALVTILTQCRPLRVIWDSSVKDAVCYSPRSLRACAYFNAGCSILADLVFALLPIPMLWKVKINTRVKIAIVGILSLGLFAVAACIVKVYYLSSYGHYNDFLWDSVNIAIWTACELNIGLFAASLATLRPLFRSVFQGSTLSNGYDSNGQKSSDKNGFVKHISNSRTTSKIRGSKTNKEDGFEMYGSVITANGKRTRIDADNESEERILPLQKPSTGIRKTTEITVDGMQTNRSVEDQV